MAQARRAKAQPFPQRARKGLAAIDEFVAYLIDKDCPECGHKSLEIEDGTLKTGIIIYCARAPLWCRWRPKGY